MERHAIGLEADAMARARARSTAISGAQPNFRDSGHSAPAPSHRMRQNTPSLAPGRPARAIFSTSASQSTAKRRDAELEGARDVALLLDRVAEGDAVRRRRRRRAPARSRRPRRVSKHEPSSARSSSTSGAGIGLHGVEHARVGERAGELGVIVAHDVEVDDEAGPVLARLRRKSRMRSVMALSPPKVNGALVRAPD